MKKLLFALLVFLWADSAWASKLTICNQHRSDVLRITMLYNNHYLKPLAQSWKVYGWMDVRPNSCQPLVQHPSGVQTFLSVKRETSYGKTLIAHYPIDNKGDTTATAERFFCVRDDPFDRVLPTLTSHETCPTGWYAQLFNLYVNISNKTNFTLRLGSSVSP